MAFDPQKKQAILDARAADKKEAAHETLKKYDSGKDAWAGRREINKFKNNAGVQNKVREQARTMGTLKGLAKSATPWGMFSVMRQGNIFKDWPYALALIAAILKDIFDLMEVTGIGYALVIVFTFLCSIFIAMMMLLGGGSSTRHQQKIIRSWLILLSGTTMELIFGIDLLPIETLTVLIIYFLLLVDRKAAAEEKASARHSQEAYA
ncbi:MAG: hypothetical protein WC022_01655 [Parcubacteria group bacterium]